MEGNGKSPEERHAGTVLTKRGVRLIAKMLASETDLRITRAAVGTGYVQEGIDARDLDDLNCYEMDGLIVRIEKAEEESQVEIAFQVSSVGVEENFVITEAGIFAEDPDEGEILYGYLDMSDDPQYVYHSRNAISKMVEITMAIVVATTDMMNVEIHPGSLVSIGDFEKLKKELKELLKQKIEELQRKIDEAEDPFVQMAEDTYIPPEKRSKGTLYGLITNKRGLVIDTYDRYLSGEEDPPVERTLYGIETQERTSAQEDTSPYAGILNNIVHIEEGQEVERRPFMIYAVNRQTGR